MFKPIKGEVELEYPCKWIFKIFGTDQTIMKDAVSKIIPDEDYSLTPSRSSSKKKYHCMNLELTVTSDENRTDIYNILSNHDDILIVL